MVAVLSKFIVANGLQDEVREAFVRRPHLVEHAKGFIRLEVLSPQENEAEFWLMTYWNSVDDFNHWHRNHRHQSHTAMPKGLRLDPAGTKLQIFEYITS